MNTRPETGDIPDDHGITVGSSTKLMKRESIPIDQRAVMHPCKVTLKHSFGRKFFAKTVYDHTCVTSDHCGVVLRTALPSGNAFFTSFDQSLQGTVHSFGTKPVRITQFNTEALLSPSWLTSSPLTSHLPKVHGIGRQLGGQKIQTAFMGL